MLVKATEATAQRCAIKGALSAVTQFLEYESPLKTMKDVFYFTLKALSVLKIRKFLSSLFSHKEKRLNRKDKVNFKIYDATTYG